MKKTLLLRAEAAARRYVLTWFLVPLTPADSKVRDNSEFDFYHGYLAGWRAAKRTITQERK